MNEQVADGVVAADADEGALRVIFRCQQNGVDRLEGAERLSREEALAEVSLPGRVPLISPLTDRIMDFLTHGLRSVCEGFHVPERHLIAGYSRALSDCLVEVVVWRVVVLAGALAVTHLVAHAAEEEFSQPPHHSRVEPVLIEAFRQPAHPSSRAAMPSHGRHG